MSKLYSYQTTKVKCENTEVPISLYSKYRSANYTTSHDTYTRAAEREVDLIVKQLKTLKIATLWHVTIDFSVYLSLASHKQIIQTINLKLKRQGLRGVYVAEPSTEGGIHYHYLVASDAEREVIRAAFAASIPEDAELKAELWVGNEPRQDVKALLAYAFKAKVTSKDGDYDIFFGRRRFFRSGLRITKTGNFGNFWQGDKGKLQDEAREKRAEAKDRDNPDVAVTARHVHSLVRDDVCYSNVLWSYLWELPEAGEWRPWHY